MSGDPTRDLAGRTALVTGGTRGIGRHLVGLLADRGARVHVCGRDAARVGDIGAAVPGAIGHTADLGVAADRRELIGSMLDAGGVDILVNNAAIGRVLDLTGAPVVDPVAEIEVNLVAPIELTLALLPTLRQRDRATVVNVGSALAYVPLAAEPVYCASKAGLHSWTRSLRAQLADDGVEVIEALLPTVDTGMAEVFDVPKISPADAARHIAEAIGGGSREIRIGQGRALYGMSRLAPRFIFRKLNETPIHADGVPVA